MTPAHALLAWYDAQRRDLPWRADRDPYRVWLSEVMLQQTRVETVVPYFQAFFARFPTVDDLAAAPLDDVLARWSGLGYYRRARQLHAAARAVVESGGFPRTVAGLLRLPGIGPYTAAAVASIAFDVVVPVVDGNVERVIARRLALAADPRSAAGRARIVHSAAALLHPDRPGDGNQALMELGATVCTPRRPRCPACPLAPGCAAREQGEPERYPPARRRRAPERQRRLLAVVERGDAVLLVRRPDDSDLLAGLWELPWCELGAGGAGREAEAKLAERYGGRWRLGERRGRVRHGITFRDLEIEVYGASLGDGGEVAEGVAGAGWFDAAARAAVPTSSLVAKALAGGRGQDGAVSRRREASREGRRRG